ncbi:unnamed protein product [Oncorhynchus mykiss]|uniref:Uncharacterized protein n=1 Tax=Oncorhynchus mykiss TaxID=8022 RepID=A0A060XX51_ONCMY|nr:unnamed protein product [Oncorhynchus mykiss]
MAKRRKCDLERSESGWDERRGAAVGGSGLRKRDLERGGVNEEGWTEERKGSAASLPRDRGDRWRELFRTRQRGSDRALSRRQSFLSALGQFRREVALSEKVLEKVKILVAAGATGMVVGAVFGAAAPLAAAAGAAAMGNTVGFAAGQLAGMSVAGGTGTRKAVGAILAAATGKTAMALGAATGGVLGGICGRPSWGRSCQSWGSCIGCSRAGEPDWDCSSRRVGVPWGQERPWGLLWKVQLSAQLP